jgi:hypothetical protein
LAVRSEYLIFVPRVQSIGLGTGTGAGTGTGTGTGTGAATGTGIGTGTGEGTDIGWSAGSGEGVIDASAVERPLLPEARGAGVPGGAPAGGRHAWWAARAPHRTTSASAAAVTSLRVFACLQQAAAPRMLMLAMISCSPDENDLGWELPVSQGGREPSAGNFYRPSDLAHVQQKVCNGSDS